MKKNNEGKTWTISFDNANITITFAESVNIRHAFKAVMAAAPEGSWVDELRSKEVDIDILQMDCMMYGVEACEGIRSTIKAIAESFPTIPFRGSAWYEEWSCYCDIDYDFSFDGSLLSMTEQLADDGNGYFCPDCGAWVDRASKVFDEGEMVECPECGEAIIASDLRFVPPVVTHYEYRI